MITSNPVGEKMKRFPIAVALFILVITSLSVPAQSLPAPRVADKPAPYRVGQWLPFMEMGNRPGVMVYHSDSYKLLGGIAEVPTDIRKHTEKYYPQYLESPRTWQDLSLNESQLTESKKEIDKRWDSDVVPVGSVFGQD